MFTRIVILLSIALFAASAQALSIEGEWTANADTGKLHLLLHVSKKSLDGTYEATLDNVEQGVNMPVSLLDYNGQDVRFELAPQAPYHVHARRGEDSERAAGSRLRIEVASASFPLWSRNLNTGGHNETETQYVTATQTVFHDATHPSHVLLPVVPE